MLNAIRTVPLILALARAAPTDWVDPFIGTTNGGHVFPGATLPFGSVKSVADCTGNENQGGFVWDDSFITGISPLHDDGTGGSPSLGQFKVFPEICPGGFDGCKLSDTERAQPRRRGTEKAHPGYFGITLGNGLELETTVTAHVALHRFTFHGFKTKQPHNPPSITKRQQEGEEGEQQEVPPPPENDDTPPQDEEIETTVPVRPPGHGTPPTESTTSTSTTPAAKPTPPPPQDSAVILFDLTQDLAHSYQGFGSMRFSTTSEPGVVRVSGTGQFVPSFGANYYRVHFCLDVPGVKNAAKYSMGMNPSPVNATGNSDRVTNSNSGALFEIDPKYLHERGNTIQTRIGVSWKNEKQACQFAEDEIPNGRWEHWSDFEVVRTNGREAWDDLLNVVEVDTTGVDNDFIVNFWSSMYRSYIAPTNITGDHELWESDEPYWDSFYCIWDSFRTVHPLYAITARTAQAEIIRALIDIWRNRGWLPDCRMSLAPGWTQGGSDADSLLADSFVKNITKGIDWNAGLRSMITDATVTPGYWDVEGRSAIGRRKELGYVLL